jgi:class 3 adenylate cyclase
VNTKFSAVRSLGISITSYAMHSPDAAWPLVSLPDFEVRAGEAIEISGADLIAFAPIVPLEDKERWEDYATKNQGWIQEGLSIQGLEDVAGTIPLQMYPFPNDDAWESKGSDIYVPVWQMGKAPMNASIVNLDLFSHPSFYRQILDVIEIKHEVLSEVVDLDFLIQYSTPVDGAYQPRSYIFEPVFETFQKDARVVGFIIAVLPWESYFVDLLPKKTNGFLVDVNDMCGEHFTYGLNGPEATYIGQGDLHDSKYDSLKVTSQFAEFARYDGDVDSNRTLCNYELNIYPTETYEDSFLTNGPIIFTSVIILVFFFTAGIFLLYDYMVQRRQNRVVSAAERTTAIVASLFPKSIQKRIMEEAEEQAAKENEKGKNRFGFAAKSQLKDFLSDGTALETGESAFKTKPIADLFPETTIIFADIVGFTAWSSMREPSQVFTLLETIYHEFDMFAKRRRVFKVETVGDCYVAVAGLPEPRKDHYTVMARFASDCLHKFKVLTKKLEVRLGPDTGDLGLRTGLHSGQVTAGVLRGERARFQLFGDTVNTTARMESTGQRDKIHISQETADLLIGAGKGHWVTPRAEKVIAKGKGELQTYWLNLRGDSSKSQQSAGSSVSDIREVETVSMNDTLKDGIINATAAPLSKLSAGKHQRLVEWNTDILLRLLREINARREASTDEKRESMPETSRLRSLEQGDIHKRETVLDEVEEIVNLPKFDAKAASSQQNPELLDLGKEVFNQLRDYVATIAAMYRDNPFHNFEHASHVTMSTVKLMSRIVAPDLKTDADADAEKNLHDHTYGITSDPLTQFACVFAALIHDVDHIGVPNSQLIKEEASVAAVYRNKSVAEQNSVDLAWDLLMDHNYEELRKCIYTTESEFKRFRQLVVNSVMATDIMDKDLKTLRNIRWEKAFSETSQKLDIYFEDTINRKATIVIEHLIQASDVSHTMQHWHIYRKWNERLFEELYRAFIQGRAETNPADNWYKGEMGFFDFYIIPLAKKLKECGVFGVSSDEYLNYAMKNRQEWELRGQEVVESMMEHVRDTYGSSTSIEKVQQNVADSKPEAVILKKAADPEPKEISPPPTMVQETSENGSEDASENGSEETSENGSEETSEYGSEETSENESEEEHEMISKSENGNEQEHEMISKNSISTEMSGKSTTETTYSGSGSSRLWNHSSTENLPRSELMFL